MGRPLPARALRHLGLIAGWLACAPAADSHGPSSARIGFWNLRRLGLESGKDVALICDLARRHFDVLGLVELMADDPTGDVGALRACLAEEFVVLETDRASPRGSPYAEHAWLALRPDSARPCQGARHELAAPPGTEGFTRPPVFACVALTSGHRLKLGVYHARWGSGAPSEVALEIVRLPRVLTEAAADPARPQADSVWLLGDLNLAPAAVTQHTGLPISTYGSGSTLGQGGEPTRHLYDQLLVMPGSALAASARVLDLRAAAGGGEHYKRALSDHLPIVAELAPQAPGARGHGDAPMP